MKKIKIHNPLLEAVQRGMENIFSNGSYADKEVQKIIRTNKQFGSKDRSFIAETIYDVVRWKNNYEILITNLQAENFDWKTYIFISLMKREYALLNPDIFGIDIEKLVLSNHPDLTLTEARTSFPGWLDQRCYRELGEPWNQIAESLNVPARIFIRANTLRTSAGKLLKILEENSIEARRVIDIDHLVPATKDCIEILSKNNLRNSDLYKQGLFEFQDIGSQVIGEFSAVQSGDTVLDLCAGAGGKTLHLSALMHNKGIIYATDHNHERLENLEKRMGQAGCRNIKIIDYQEAKQLSDIDLLLMDAPCSGLGTVKRHPDIKWKLQDADIENYISIQKQLLEDHHHQVSKSGRMVYATCSILPSENEEQVNKFVENNPGMKLKRELRLKPDVHGCDGFYMAEISR